MKLIIQIPCYNEEKSLPEALADLPREVKGFSKVEWLVVDDGSIDKTAEVAKSHGVDHVVKLPSNQGLAKAFTAGIAAALKLQADVIVNTDADNQYDARDIPKLTEPIVKGQCDMVIGTRPIQNIEHFSWTKKKLQGLGSHAIRTLSGTDVQDAPSGFRAISRNAALRINIFSRYTYTLESIIQAGQNGLIIQSVPVNVNGETRPSRLVKNIRSYVKKSTLTMFRIFMIYRPMRFFLWIAGIFLFMGSVFGLRYFYFILIGEGKGHIQSVVLSALLISMATLIATFACIADLISVNRRLLEDLKIKFAKLEDQMARSDEDS